jgi:Tol biopolymer transport system component
VEAAHARGPRAHEAALGLCHNSAMRAPVLVAALLALLALGAQRSDGAAVTRNGRIAYEHVGNGNRFQIYTVTATGEHRTHLTTGHRYSSFDPSYAPRGKRIVFVRSFKQSDLWTMDADGAHQRPLTSTAGVDELDPSWSPTGKEVVFAVSSPASLHGLWVIGSDGSDRRQLTTGVDTGPSWSPDGSRVAFTRGEAIWIVPAAGGTPTQVTSPGTDSDGEPYFDGDPRWSPDGSRILFVSDRGDPAESADQLDLWVMNADGSDLRHVTNTQSRDELDAAWSPDGERIVYSSRGTFHGASSSQIYVSAANGKNRRILTHACGECAWINDDPSWQPLPG